MRRRPNRTSLQTNGMKTTIFHNNISAFCHWSTRRALHEAEKRDLPQISIFPTIDDALTLLQQEALKHKDKYLKVHVRSWTHAIALKHSLTWTGDWLAVFGRWFPWLSRLPRVKVEVISCLHLSGCLVYRFLCLYRISDALTSHTYIVNYVTKSQMPMLSKHPCLLWNVIDLSCIPGWNERWDVSLENYDQRT